ncbi:hypothetical protein GOP47_0019718 [Adiantum capillus-veneris]|uniref:K Homology domain-containing protein n=1 Tax=Adiantum capillus-veneris TaxID=13818 RepID=A0A9D4UBK2_ADICA|nr:hypothetical protein GOP47_0019718 [Adiantum capillus-veneris]
MESYGGLSGKRALHEDDAAERNGRQKKRSSSNSELPAQAEETEYRILCPVSKIGSLIGKGGSTIKALRTECRSKIKVEDPVSGSDERVVLISSSADQFREQGYYVCAAQEALFKVHARITEADDDDDEPPQPVFIRLLVPKSHIGCLLGKGGKIIEQMRKEIGAQIRILPKEQQPPCAGSIDELVQVTGDAALVRKALFEISTRLHENITGERTQKGAHVSQGSGGMMAPMFAAAGGMYPSMGYLQAGSLLGPSSVGDPMQGLGYSYGGMYGDASMGQTWGVSMPSAATGGLPHSDGATEEEFTIRMLCPNTRIGSIIGKGGNVIKKMREETGAKIKVEEPIPDCDERVVLIIASEYVNTYPSHVIQATMQVFRRLAELQLEKDMDNKSFIVRLLVPSTQIGCLLGKGGSIVNEMRKTTKATIRISPKDEPSKCAEENDELVQIMGDQSVVQDALVQILNRLRGNVFKGQEGSEAVSGFGSSILPMSGAVYSGTNMLSSYRGGLDSGAAGTTYPLTNMGYPSMDFGYGGISSQPSFGKEREGKDSRRRQR